MFTNIDAVKDAYEGRMGRESFIPLAIVIIIGELILNMFVVNPLAIMLVPSGMFAGLLALIIALAYAFVTLHVFVRRLHDIGQTGWWVLVGMVPYLGALLSIILFFVLAIKEGDAHANKYGPKDSRKRSPFEAFFNK